MLCVTTNVCRSFKQRVSLKSLFCTASTWNSVPDAATSTSHNKKAVTSTSHNKKAVIGKSAMFSHNNPSGLTPRPHSSGVLHQDGHEPTDFVTQPVSNFDKLVSKLQTVLPGKSRSELSVLIQELRQTRGSLSGFTAEDITQQIVTMVTQPETKSTSVIPEKPSSNKTLEDELATRISEARKSVCKSVADFQFNKKRIQVLSQSEHVLSECDGIVYWMSRDQRVQDNWAFLYAQKLALKQGVPLHVCFCLVPKFLDATIRHFTFMLEGLREVEKECTELGISFHLLIGHAKDRLPQFVAENKIGGVVTDFSPLRVPMAWVDDVGKALPKNVHFCKVHAHNIVPCWEASNQMEHESRTIRLKINSKLSEYLTEFPPVCKHTYDAPFSQSVDWAAAYSSLEVDQTVRPVEWAKPGYLSGMQMLESFCKYRLKDYVADRNNPTVDAISNLSPWFHFGQVSIQRAILTVSQYQSLYKASVDKYIDEAVIWRELADNLCYYNKNYDSLDGAPDWAKATLREHERDRREYVYTRKQFERGQTHDPLWNAAQNQMVLEGKMHGFLRMYWAKKILEWTPSPSEALSYSIYLNDKYSLDGRDPNGYVGCMWSICGIHDQGWAERAVFGKIRYMNYQGCKRKFDVTKFEMRYRKQTTEK
ncbi:deoxyribodipyrimidine photo-lyase-like isoform X1 [Dreissena polymorpha]|uniref:deoxyribodipyrimidine photo-lyase-like isoform X1 n=1 Tax=Dreissena polymorpha TaxID=45954 RepID=UPI0022648479|nr:deoxyribodipyrimidine photo-lyase-like isoform X1 [Dreissena polymorpha]